MFIQGNRIYQQMERVNIELLKRRLRELTGVTRDTDIIIDSEALAIAFKLQNEHKSVTEENILIERMKLVLKDMSHRDQMKPFLTAICSMYECYAVQRPNQTKGSPTPLVLGAQNAHLCSCSGVEKEKA